MSHASGIVVFSDRSVLWFEYNGTVDCVLTRLYKTRGELSAHWRTDDCWADCTCRNAEPVVVHSSYGYGFWWKSTACRKCMALSYWPSPFDENCEMLGRGSGPSYADQEPWVRYAYEADADAPVVLSPESVPPVFPWRLT